MHCLFFWCFCVAKQGCCGVQQPLRVSGLIGRRPSSKISKAKGDLTERLFLCKIVI